MLEGILRYGQYEFIFQENTHIAMRNLNEEEEMWSLLEKEIADADLDTVKSDSMVLPQRLNDMEVHWEKRTNYRGAYIMFLGGCMVILLLVKKRQEIQQYSSCRKEQMEKDYPEIVSTFLLYMGAGMSVKNSWGKIIEDYAENSGQRFIYEEMSRTYKEMSNGKSEIQAYEDFGQRVQILVYRKFAILLVQNVKKGTKGMVLILEREAQEAFNSRKRKAKSMGEEAGTKLLLPMFMMLSVVLCIIVVPAFLTVQL